MNADNPKSDTQRVLQSTIRNPKCFAVGEKRQLTIASLSGADCRLSVEQFSVEDRGQYRHYRSTVNGQPLHIQLNHGDPADDQARLEEIIKDILDLTPEIFEPGKNELTS